MSGSAPSRPISSRNSYWRPSRQKLLPRCRFLQVPIVFRTTLREGEMPDKITYYAIVDDLSSRERPAGIFRRIYFETGGKRDEAFTTNLVWKRSSSLVSAERGDLENEFVEISEVEANQLMEELRARWTGAGSG